jgi:hypothetical protein
MLGEDPVKTLAEAVSAKLSTERRERLLSMVSKRISSSKVFLAHIAGKMLPKHPANRRMVHAKAHR